VESSALFACSGQQTRGHFTISVDPDRIVYSAQRPIAVAAYAEAIAPSKIIADRVSFIFFFGEERLDEYPITSKPV
jgi:hypothetical protein